MRRVLCMMAAVGLALALFAPRAEAVIRYWVAPAAGNWTNTANWSASSGGSGGDSVPGSTDDAIFDDGGAGNCSLNAAVNVLGLRLESGFSGTVIQTDKTVTIGSNGYYQAGGVFAGGSTNILIYYASASVTNTLFTLAGGIFTNTSGKLSLYRNGNGFLTELVFTNGTFSHNNGTLGFDSENSDGGAANIRTVSISKTLTLKHLSFGRGNSYSGYGLRYAFDQTSGGELIVEGDFIFNPAYWVGLNSGTIKARGNVAVGSKAIGVAATLMIDGTGDQTYTASGGTWPYLTVAKPSGSFAPASPTDTNVVMVVPRFALANGTFVAPAGRMDIVGTDAVTFSYTNGTFTANGGKLRMASYHGNGGGIWHSTLYLRKPLILKDLCYYGGNYYSSATSADYTLDTAGEGSLVVEGDFFFRYADPNATAHYLKANGGTIEVKGNVGIGASTQGGTTKIILSGTGTQMVTHAAGIPPQGQWKIDKAAGTVLLASNLTIAAAGQDLVWTNGALDLSSNVLTVGRNVSIASGATTLGLTVADATTAGRMIVTGAVSGLANARLFVTILAQPDAVEGRTYMILSNNTALAESFIPESWCEGWRGRVDYTGTANDRKNVKLVEIAKIINGTIITCW